MLARTRLPLRLACALCLAAALTAASPCRAQGLSLFGPSSRFEQKVSLDSRGNAAVSMKWALSRQEYARLKELLTLRAKLNFVLFDWTASRGATPSGALSFLGLRDLPFHVEDLKGSFDDRQRTFTAGFRIPGWAANSDSGEWSVDLLDNLRWYFPTDLNAPPVAGAVPLKLARYQPSTRTAVVETAGDSARFAGMRLADLEKRLGATHVPARIEVTLPAGAGDVALRRRANGLYALSFAMPGPAAQGSKARARPPSIRVEPRRYVVPMLHKLYGDPTWASQYLARTRFHNPGAQDVTDVRVRVRLQTTRGRTDWGEWQDVCAVVHPGQTAQFPIHASVDASVCDLDAAEAGTLHLQWQYSQAGRTKERSVAGRVQVLGRRHARFTLLDLGRLGPADVRFSHGYRDGAVMVTAMTTCNDPVIKELRGRVSRMVDGVPPTDDESTRRYLEAAYNVLRANINYALPGGVDRAVAEREQHVYLARDVLRYKSGCCVDLSVLLAALAEASGIETHIVIVPGHAFPAFRLPGSKKLLFLEATACGGGEMGKSAPFALATEAAARTYEQYRKEGNVIVVNVSFLRQFVPHPELLAKPGDDPLRNIQPPPARPRVRSVKLLSTAEDVVRGGRRGVELRVRVELDQAARQGFTAYAVLTDGKGQPVKTTNPAYGTPPFFALGARYVAASAPFRTGPALEASQEVTLFLPHDQVPGWKGGAGGTFKLSVKVWSDVYGEVLEAPVKVEHSFRAPAKATAAR
jgi:hypothetical protein